MKPSGPVTLRALAQQLALDVSTVSRVLNGSEEHARSAAAPETVQRIRALAAQLNYRSNPHAASLKTRRSHTIGVLVPRLSDLVLATIYEGIDAAAANRGYLTFVSNTQDEPARQRKLTDMALARRADGLIMGDAHSAAARSTAAMGSSISDNPLLDELAERGVPFVLVSRHCGPHCAVTCDDVAGGRLAARHLLAQGHKDVAVMSGESFTSTGRDRTAGFLAYCREHGIDVPAPWRVSSAYDSEAGHAIGAKLLRAAKRPSAIFAVNDFLAIGVMGAVRDCGMTPGKDVAIVGYNDTPLAASLPIGLTSIRSPMQTMGERGFELLLRKIAGEQPASERLAPMLIVRGSSM